jgi:ATP-binding cassette subfamily C protein
MKFIKNIKHFIFVIGSQKKKYFFFLIFLLILQSFLELFSLVLIIPIINLLLNEKINFFSNILILLNFEIVDSKENVILLFLSIVLFFFVFKNLSLYKINKLYLNFAFDVQTSLKNYIFYSYLNKNFNEMKTSKLISDLSVNCTLLSNTFTVPLMILSSELLILILILFFLFFFYTKAFLVLFFFIIIIGFIYFSIISSKLKKIGIIKEINENHQVNAITNAIGSIKISRIYNLEKKLFSDFSIFNENSSLSLSKLNLLSNLPRFILELIGFLGLSSVLIYLILSNVSDQEVILTIGIFSVSAFKIMPSINRIMNAIQHINFSNSIFLSLLNNIIKPIDLKNIKIIKKNKKLIKKNISFNNVNFSYPDSDKKIIKNLNFSLKKGINIGITGDSGIGKSTFLDLLLGFRNISMGLITIDGKKINSLQDEWLHNFSYVAQENYMFDDTLLNNIILNKKKINKENLFKIHIILKALKLDSLIISNPEGINMKIGEKGVKLSSGQLQRIAIARAIFLNRPFIVMDEPTNALDFETEEYFFSNVKKICNSTFVIVSHTMKTFKNCDIIYKFYEGGRLKIIKN